MSGSDAFENSQLVARYVRSIELGVQLKLIFSSLSFIFQFYNDFFTAKAWKSVVGVKKSHQFETLPRD